jgi:flagellar motor switch protein FliN/FliY
VSELTMDSTTLDRAEIKRILKIEVPVIVRLAEKRMPMREVLNMSIGSIIEFEKPAEDVLDLMINNRKIGSGEAVKIGEKFGLKITEVGSISETIEKLRG